MSFAFSPDKFELGEAFNPVENMKNHDLHVPQVW